MDGGKFTIWRSIWEVKAQNPLESGRDGEGQGVAPKSETSTGDIFSYVRIGEMYPKGTTPHQLNAFKNGVEWLALFGKVIHDLLHRSWTFSQGQLR